MKRLIFLIAIFIATSTYLRAQEGVNICGLDNEATTELVGDYSGSIDPDYLAQFQPIVFNIKFWGVNRPDGTNGFPNRENQTLEAIANLNITLNPYNIFFKYRGYEEFDSPVLDGDSNGYYILESPAQFYGLRDYAADNGYVEENAFNVYAYGWGSFGGISDGIGATISGMSTHNLSTPIFVHEIGHNLGLRHTRSPSEHVTRDMDDPNFNALTTGDKILDTAANLGFHPLDDYPFINDDCTYISGIEVDTSEPPRFYEIFPEDVINTMGNAYDCMEYFFTNGQGIKMRETIETGYFAFTATSIASLYEPYTGIYLSCCYGGGDKPPLLQPGFSYEFVACKDFVFPSDGRPEPWPYDDLSFETGDVVYSFNKNIDISDFDKIKHLNGTAIVIKQIDESQSRRCYSDLSKSAMGGAVVKFNDGVLNSNVTVSPKDSLGINNPNLIIELENGLYLIETNFDDGTQDQQIIIKDNNQ